MERKVLLFAVLLVVVPLAHAVPTCSGLIGTWQASYKIGPARFVDKIIIRVTASTGAISGMDEYGYAMHGFCKNGTVFFTGDSDDIYLEAYYFTNGAPGFGRHLGTTSYVYNFEATFHAAAIKKISSSTTRVAPAGAAIPSRYSKSYRKMQASQIVASTSRSESHNQ